MKITGSTLTTQEEKAGLLLDRKSTEAGQELAEMVGGRKEALALSTEELTMFLAVPGSLNLKEKKKHRQETLVNTMTSLVH
jgi:hypothetical protein